MDPRIASNAAHACCGRWAGDRARLALYHEGDGSPPSAWSFWDIQREANRLSNVLAAFGVARGDRVAVAGAPRPETAIAHIACYQSGAVVVPVGHGAGDDLAALAESCAIRAAVLDSAALDAIREVSSRGARRVHALTMRGTRATPWARAWDDVLPLASTRYAGAPLQAQDDALCLCRGDDSAGTSVDHGALLAAMENFAAIHTAYPQQGDLLWAPGDWDDLPSLCAGLLSAWSAGQPVLCAGGPFDGAKAFRLMEKYGVRNLLLSPAQLGMMMRAAPAPKAEYDVQLRTLACRGSVDASARAWVREHLAVDIVENAERGKAGRT